MINFKAAIDRARALDSAFAQQLDPKLRRAFAWIGRDLQRAGRKLLRPPKQKRVSDLTEEERNTYRKNLRLFRAGIRNTKPKRPPLPAEEGEPPRIRYSPNPLRDGFTGIRFALNDNADGVVAGPSNFGDNAAEQIEERHPFMAVAIEKVRPTIPKTLQRATAA